MCLALVFYLWLLPSVVGFVGCFAVCLLVWLLVLTDDLSLLWLAIGLVGLAACCGWLVGGLFCCSLVWSCVKWVCFCGVILR